MNKNCTLESKNINIQTSILPEFKAEVKKIYSELSRFKEILDQQEQALNELNGRDRIDFFNTILHTTGREFYEFLDKSVYGIVDLIGGLTQLEQDDHGKYLRNCLWDFFQYAPFHKRSLEKPLGYSGDYGLMEMLYDNRFEGETLFGKFLHRHPMKRPMPGAVRSRRQMIHDIILEEMSRTTRRPFRILSVACGPAKEIADLYQNSREAKDVEVTLLDQDVEALERARENVFSVSWGDSGPINYVNESVRRLMHKTQTLIEPESYDLVYSMGLFDYLTVRTSNVLLGGIHWATAPGGRIVVGNFHDTTPEYDKKYMDLFLDWQLIYKSDEDIKMFVQGLPESTDYKITRERSGCQAFVDIRKNKSDKNL